VSIEPLRESLDAAPRSWAAPARPLLPLAVFCAADLGENGALCDHLLAACPDRPVCDAEHPFDPSTRCLRRDCDGQHDPFGLPAWSADIPTEEDPMSTTELAETEQAMQDAIVERLRDEGYDTPDAAMLRVAAIAAERVARDWVAGVAGELFQSRDALRRTQADLELNLRAEVPEVGTIAHYRYIGDGKAERDLLSQLLRGMARRASGLRRANPSRLR